MIWSFIETTKKKLNVLQALLESSQRIGGTYHNKSRKNFSFDGMELSSGDLTP